MIGCAQTGTGKTAAFALPLLQHLINRPVANTPRGARILVLSPTRELASQIHEAFGTYGRFLNFRRAAIFGGVNAQGQIKTMGRGVEVLVATPGRLLDLMNQGRVDLSSVEALVLDEADRMLDMGFYPDIRKIAAKTPSDRQTLMFSATMSPNIAKLAKSLLRDPVRIDVAPQATPAETVDQQILFVERSAKTGTLIDLLTNGGIYRAIVFTRTKHGANRLDAQLHKSGVKTIAIHGNKSQNARKRALAAFHEGHLQVLVATDVAARGLDIDDVTHVINYDMPDQPDAYIHRIGRTGRAGATGIAISMVDGSERSLLRDIERMIGRRLTGDGEALPPSAPRKNGPGKNGAGKNGAGKSRPDGSGKKFGKKKKAKKTQYQQGQNEKEGQKSRPQRPGQESGKKNSAKPKHMRGRSRSGTGRPNNSRSNTTRQAAA